MSLLAREMIKQALSDYRINAARKKRRQIMTNFGCLAQA